MNNDSMATEEHNKIIIELKREYETLEKSFWVTVSFLLAVIAHLLYNDWFLTIGILIGVFFLGWRFLAKRPFTNNSRIEMGNLNDR
ncbi:MAG: hypothetical protein O6852_07130 [Gammaproteobacteria bacterium]|nr:hypothetical protein [Gammaproteobacteria bacterium]